jgi:hypothetical protein
MRTDEVGRDVTRRLALQILGLHDGEALRHRAADAHVAPAGDVEAVGVHRLVELLLQRVTRLVELGPRLERARHLQGDDRLVNRRETDRGDRRASDLTRLDLADHAALGAGGAVPQPLNVDRALRLLVDGLGPRREDLAPGALLGRQRREPDRRLVAPALLVVVACVRRSRDHRQRSGGERRSDLAHHLFSSPVELRVGG